MGSERPEPLEQELFKTAGEVYSLNFEQIKRFVRERHLANQQEAPEVKSLLSFTPVPVHRSTSHT